MREEEKTSDRLAAHYVESRPSVLLSVVGVDSFSLPLFCWFAQLRAARSCSRGACIGWLALVVPVVYRLASLPKEA